MSAKRINIKAWECRCERPQCPGKGKPWISKGKELPKYCVFCKTIRWNGQPDRRVRAKKMTDKQRREYNRLKQQQSRARRKQEQKGKYVPLERP